MSSFAAKFVAKKVLGESLQNQFGTEVCYLLLCLYNDTEANNVF